MRKILLFSALVLVAACSKSPEKRFAKICDNEVDESRKASCLCTAKELTKQLDEEKYELLVTEMEKAKNENGGVNFGAVIKSEALDQQTLMAFISSAKKCGPVR